VSPAFPLVGLVIAFAIGSIPTAYWMGRWQGLDIRHYGSGNVGATNALRVLGVKWGIVCLGLDVLKGYLPTALALLLPGEVFAIGWPPNSWPWAVGAAAIVGHMFSPFLKFCGGKGVATAIGVILAMAWLPILLALIVGTLIIWLTGYVSVASIAGAALLPFLILLFQFRQQPWISILVTALLAVVIIWKHRANIDRLRNGTEPRVFDQIQMGKDEGG